MRIVLQRVKSASVSINGEISGTISGGMVVFLGISKTDTTKDLHWMVEKVINLRIFDDQNGKMNMSLADISGEMLIISQFTLYGDCRKGRRPGFSAAAPPELAQPLYEEFVKEVKNRQIKVASGTFQAEMEIQLVNQGPVTLLLDSEKKY